MDDKSANQEKSKETPEAASAREAFIFEQKIKEIKTSLKRQQFLEEQSWREGFRFLFKSILQFVFFVSAGVLLIVKGHELQVLDGHGPRGAIFIALGAILVLNGMLSLGGLRSK